MSSLNQRNLSNSPDTNKSNKHEESIKKGTVALEKLKYMFCNGKSLEPKMIYSEVQLKMNDINQKTPSLVKELNELIIEMEYRPEAGVDIENMIREIPAGHTISEDLMERLIKNIKAAIQKVPRLGEVRKHEIEKNDFLGSGHEVFNMSVSKEKNAISAKMDKMARAKMVNIDVNFQDNLGIRHTYHLISREFIINTVKIKRYIDNSNNDFYKLAGRKMRNNEFEKMVEDIDKFKKGFDIVKGTTQDKLVELVTLSKACNDFVNENDLYSKYDDNHDRYSRNSDGEATRLKDFDDKSKSIQIIKSVNDDVNTTLDFLVQLTDKNYSKNFIKNYSGSTVSSNPNQTKPIEASNDRNVINFRNSYISEGNTLTQPSRVENSSDSIPQFSKPTQTIEKKVESVETTSEFVDKYFNKFDAFLVTEVGKSKINGEEVLKFTGEGHKEGQIAKNSYAKLPTNNLSKFELQLLGKIAEKYNTIPGIQVWIGNGQIGFVDDSGNAIEVLN